MGTEPAQPLAGRRAGRNIPLAVIGPRVEQPRQTARQGGDQLARQPGAIGAHGRTLRCQRRIIGFASPAREEQGADPLLWEHLFWIFGHPEVYIVIMPAMGVVSDVISTFSRRPLFGYKAMVYSLLGIAGLMVVRLALVMK